jgi:hypothetical protein
MARARANKEPGPADDLRAKAHETLDAWLDQFEPTQTEPPTLFSLSMQMLVRGAAINDGLVIAIIDVSLVGRVTFVC